MSQIQFAVNGGAPAVPTTFHTDSGDAIPVGNALTIAGGTSNSNSNNGIATVGSGSTVTIDLTNRLQGSGSTIGAVTGDIITFALGAIPGTYAMEFRIAAFEPTTPAGCSYSVFGGVRTTGAAASIVGTPDKLIMEDAALNGADVSLVASGNNAILRVTGVGGLTVDWSIVGLYTLAT